MRITKLELTNFRCFEHATINLAAATVLVGRNDAGKSTIVDAIRALYYQTDHLDRPFTWSSVIRRAPGMSAKAAAVKAALASVQGSHHSDFPSARVLATLGDLTAVEEATWEPFLTMRELRIGVDFKVGSDPRYFVVIPSRSEELIIGPDPDSDWLMEITIDLMEEGRAVNTIELPALDEHWPTSFPPRPPAFPPIASMPDIHGPESEPLMPERFLRQFILDRLFDHYAELQIAKGRVVDDIVREWPGLIQSLHAAAISAASEVRHDYEAVVSKYLPDVEEAWIRVSNPPHRAFEDLLDVVVGSVSLAFGAADQRIELEDLGGGSRRAASIAALELYQSATPEHGQAEGAVICLVEEPEVGLHAAAQRRVAGALQGIAATGKQVVVVSHSPTIIDSFPLESVRTVHAATDSHYVSQPVELGEVARLLGATPSDALLASHIVVVEGESDRAVLSMWSVVNGIGFEAARTKVVAAGGYAQTEFVAKLARTLLSDTRITVVLDNGRDTAKLALEINEMFGSNVKAELLQRSEIEAYFNRELIGQWFMAAGADEHAVAAALQAIGQAVASKALLRRLCRQLLKRDYRVVDDGVAIASRHKESDLAPDMRGLLTRLVG